MSLSPEQHLILTAAALGGDLGQAERLIQWRDAERQFSVAQYLTPMQRREYWSYPNAPTPRIENYRP